MSRKRVQCAALWPDDTNDPAEVKSRAAVHADGYVTETLCGYVRTCTFTVIRSYLAKLAAALRRDIFHSLAAMQRVKTLLPNSRWSYLGQSNGSRYSARRQTVEKSNRLDLTCVHLRATLFPSCRGQVSRDRAAMALSLRAARTLFSRTAVRYLPVDEIPRKPYANDRIRPRHVQKASSVLYFYRVSAVTVIMVR